MNKVALLAEIQADCDKILLKLTCININMEIGLFIIGHIGLIKSTVQAVQNNLRWTNVFNIVLGLIGEIRDEMGNTKSIESAITYINVILDNIVNHIATIQSEITEYDMTYAHHAISNAAITLSNIIQSHQTDNKFMCDIITRVLTMYATLDGISSVDLLGDLNMKKEINEAAQECLKLMNDESIFHHVTCSLTDVVEITRN